MKYFSWWVGEKTCIVTRAHKTGYEIEGLLAAMREQLALEDSRDGTLVLMGRGTDMKFTARFFGMTEKKFMRLIKQMQKRSDLFFKDGYICLAAWEGEQARFFENRDKMRDFMRKKRAEEGR